MFFIFPFLFYIKKSFFFFFSFANSSSSLFRWCLYLTSFFIKIIPIIFILFHFSFFVIIFYLFKLDQIPSLTLSFFEHYFYLIHTQIFNCQLVRQIISFSSLFPMIKSFSNYSCPFHYYLFIVSFSKSNIIFLSH